MDNVQYQNIYTIKKKHQLDFNLNAFLINITKT
jgi:hypothetical protein